MKGVLAEAGEAGRKAEGGYRSTVTCGVPRCAGTSGTPEAGTRGAAGEAALRLCSKPFIAAHSTHTVGCYAGPAPGRRVSLDTTESAVTDCRESGREVQLGQGAAVLEGTAADRGHARRKGDLAQGTTSREGADADGCEARRKGQLHEGSGVDECARREDGRARETEQVRAGRQSVAHQAGAWHQAALLNCVQSATQLILRRREAQRASSWFRVRVSLERASSCPDIRRLRKDLLRTTRGNAHRGTPPRA